MKNIVQVCMHLKNKTCLSAHSNPDKSVITLIKTKQDLDFFNDNAGNYWRMYIFLKDTRSYDLVTTEQQAKQGGIAFGRFQAFSNRAI